MAIPDKKVGDEPGFDEKAGAGLTQGNETPDESPGEKPQAAAVSVETKSEPEKKEPADKAKGKPRARRKIKRLDRAVGMEMPSNRYRTFLGTGAIPPVSEKKHFVAKLKNLDILRVTILEGDSDKASENILVGEIGLTNITLREDGRAEVEIDFTLDDKGMLLVRLTDRMSETESMGRFILPQFMDEFTDRGELKGLPVEQLSKKIDLLEQQISVLEGELEVRRVKE